MLFEEDDIDSDMSLLNEFEVRSIQQNKVEKLSHEIGVLRIRLETTNARKIFFITCHQRGQYYSNNSCTNIVNIVNKISENDVVRTLCEVKEIAHGG